MEIAATVTAIVSAITAAVMAVLARQQVKAAQRAVEEAQRSAALAELAVQEARRSADTALAALPINFAITPKYGIQPNILDPGPIDLIVENSASTVFVHSARLVMAEQVDEVDADGWSGVQTYHDLELTPAADQTPLPVRLHQGEQVEFEVPDDFKTTAETLGHITTAIRYSLVVQGDVFERTITTDLMDTVREVLEVT